MMRRGFLNNTDTRTRPSTAVSPFLGRLTAVDSTSPPDVTVLGFLHTRGTFELKAHISPPDYTKERSPICTRVPSSPIDSRGTTECALLPETMRRLSSFPRYPRSPVPEPHVKAYEIRETANKGLGMFALRNLEVGDLILVERPLMVLPVMKHTEDPAMTADDLAVYLRSLLTYSGPGFYFEGIPRLQAMLVEALFERMKRGDQDAFRNLANVFRNDEHFYLLGRWRTNAVGIEDLGLGDGSHYEAVCRDSCRINHSCRPNCGVSFDVSSFSVEVRASKAIAKDEEILKSYSVISAPTNERQAQLKKWKITCTCDSCKHNPVNVKHDELRVSLQARFNYLAENTPPIMNRLLASPLTILQEIHSNLVPTRAAIDRYREKVDELLNDMKDAGLEGSILYAVAMKFQEVASVGHAMTSVAALPHDRNHFQQVKSELGEAMQTIVDYNMAHFGSKYDAQGFLKFARENFL